MRLNEIINSLCNHEISKDEAIEKISSIINSFKRREPMEFTVQDVKFSVQDNHGYLFLKIPYGYSKIEGKFKLGDAVDVFQCL